MNKLLNFLQHRLYYTDCISLLLGLLLPLAFAPLNFYLLAFILPAIFLLILKNTTVQRAFWRGWLFGFGIFIIGVSWVFVSFYVYGGMPFWLAALVTIGFIAVLGLFFSVQAYCFVKFFSRTRGVVLAIAFASCWVLQELLRTYVLSGFPWLLLGYAQTTTWMQGYAPIISVYGISFISAFIAGLLVNFVYEKKFFWTKSIMIILLIIFGFVLSQKSWTIPINQPLRVNLIQGNVAQSIKWQPDQLASILARYQTQTENNWDADLIVWPEGALPDLLSNHRVYFQDLNIKAAQHNASLIAGLFLADNDQQHFYNSLTVLGLGQGEYHKRHLVPFGEYVPFETLLRGLMTFLNLPMSALSPGESEQPLMKVKRNKIGAYLCYEIAYPMIVRSDLPDANLLLTATDDSWFGKSWAGVQMLQIAQMRSIETGREQLVVGNDSHTAIINTHGNIIAESLPYQAAVLNGVVQPYQGATPWVFMSPYIWLGIVVLLTLICFIYARRDLT